MRRWTTLVLAALLAVACSDEPGSDADRAKEEIGEAYEATKDYLAEQKNEFLSSLKSGVDSLEDDLAKLRARAANAGDGVREKLNELVAELEGRKAELEAEIQAASEKTAENWKYAKTGLEATWKELKQDVDQALDDSGS